MLGLGCASPRAPLTVALDRDAAAQPVPLEVVGTSRGTSETRRPRRTHIEWSNASEEASTRGRAARERRAVLVYFSATWCAACAELEQTTFRDTSVVARTTELESIQVDATNDDDPKWLELSKKYRVVGLPTLVMLDARGVEVFRITHYVNGPELAAALETARP
jgi:thioredoxin:protein disulfide reductase